MEKITPSENEKISIIVVNYNCSKLANRCLKSILDDKVTADKEIIFIDNASSDLKFIDKKILSKVSTKIFNDINFGVSHARNTGLNVANGKYVCFIDSDDVFLQGKLQKQLNFLNNNKQFFMVCSNYFRIDDLNKLSKKTGINSKTGEIFFSNLVKTNSIALSSVMCRNDNKALRFDNGIREDYKLWLKILKNGMRVWFMKDPLVGYYLPNKMLFIIKKSKKLTKQWKVQRGNSGNFFVTFYNFINYGINAIIKLWRI